MQSQNGPTFYRSIGYTHRLHDFASSRCKLRNGATCPPSPSSDRKGRAPNFKARTGKPTYMMVLRSKPPRPSISTWPPRVLLDVDTWSPPSPWQLHPAWLDRCHLHPSMYSCSSLHHVDRSWLHLDFLGPSIQAYSYSPFTDLGSSARTFSFDLHRLRRPPRRILRLHITSQEISNLYNLVNHSSSIVYHHWSSVVDEQ